MLLLSDLVQNGPVCVAVLEETTQVLVRPSSFGPRSNVWLYGRIFVREALILKELGTGKRTGKAKVVGWVPKEDPP